MLWAHGYNVEVGYTFGYYRELDPVWLDLCVLVARALPPSYYAKGKLKYIEFGCGQGLNLCLIAACNPQIEFIGIDFNPQQIAHAQKLAKAAGLPNVQFWEADFIELARNWPKELGKFHYAVAHGIISWIPNRVREALYQCLESALYPGAIVYLSYNTMPGWISALPIQHLLKLWQEREVLSAPQTIDKGYVRLMKLLETNTLMCRVLPQIKSKIEKLHSLDKSYLIHEYLHDEWRPFWFDEVAKDLHSRKLIYLGTATTSDWFLPAMLPKEWREILVEYADPIVRETMLDVIINQSFRRDLWIKGKSPLWEGELEEIFSNIKFILLHKVEANSEGENIYKFQTGIGEISGNPEFYRPIYSAFKSGPKSIKDLHSLMEKQKATFGDIIKAIGLMLNAGHLAIYRGPTDGIQRSAKSLNQAILSAIWKGAPYRYLIASQIPWVISLSEFDLLFTYAKLHSAKADPPKLGEIVTTQLKRLGKNLIKDGKPLEDFEETKRIVTELAEKYLNNTLPVLQQLGVL